MVRPRQVGPDLPSGVRRPDRAVSLRDVRDLPVQTMGGLGEFDRLMGQMPEITETLDYYINQVLPGLSLDELEKEIEELSNAVEGGTSVGVGEMEDGDRLDAAIEERGERAAAGEGGLGWQGERQEASEEGRKVFGAESRGLTADEAFRQHHAMAGGEPPREGRAHPERVPAPYEPAPPMSDEEREEATRRYKEEIEKIRRDNPGVFNPEARAEPHPNLGGAFLGEPRVPYPGQQRVPLDVVGEPGSTPPRRVPYPGQQRVPLDVVNAPPGNSRRPRFIDRPNVLNPMAGPDWEAIEEGDYGAGNWWDTVPGMDDLGDALPDPDEPLNPELRSMDSQMLADMMVSQPEQGYFGGLGDAVQGLTNRVAGMSGMERAALIAALVAAGLITVGSGGMLTPVGVGLAGGAGLTALNQ